MLLGNGRLVREVWNVGSDRFGRPVWFHASLWMRNLRPVQIWIIVSISVLFLQFDVTLLFGKLIKGRNLVGSLVWESFHFELQFMAFGKLALRNDVVFLIMKLFLRVLHRLFLLELAALPGLYSEVCVGLGVSLWNSWRALLGLRKLPHGVLAHTPVFKRFYLRAHTFQWLDKGFVRLHSLIQLGREIVRLIRIQSHHLWLEIAEKTLVNWLLLRGLFLPLFHAFQFLTINLDIQRAPDLTWDLRRDFPRFVSNLIRDHLFLQLHLILAVKVCAIRGLGNI